ncbi:MAG: twin-arginine translocation signal domain-containing protein, partial [Achromobacter sp.]|nr:twin-arginine translocation signal domain-containing protein [Achromobacter sp.]
MTSRRNFLQTATGAGFAAAALRPASAARSPSPPTTPPAPSRTS